MRVIERAWSIAKTNHNKFNLSIQLIFSDKFLGNRAALETLAERSRRGSVLRFGVGMWQPTNVLWEMGRGGRGWTVPLPLDFSFLNVLVTFPSCRQ